MGEIVLFIWQFIVINYVISLIGLVLSIALVIMQWRYNKKCKWRLDDEYTRLGRRNVETSKKWKK